MAHTFQIYFDFSAYSDMAIGLGRMFGFHFLENFNYPYISQSVTEFWRRWHISLSTWFRDYVYIPLGGNRCVKWKHVRNITVVWLLTGLWHGAAWTFILWGVWFCLLLLGEKFLWGGVLNKTPALVRHGYTMLAVVISWVLFRSVDLPQAWAYLGAMFGQTTGLAQDGPGSLLSAGVLAGVAAGHRGQPAGEGLAPGEAEAGWEPGADHPHLGAQGTGSGAVGAVLSETGHQLLQPVHLLPILRRAAR